MIEMLALEWLISRAGIFRVMSRIPELWNGLHSSWHGVWEQWCTLVREIGICQVFAVVDTKW